MNEVKETTHDEKTARLPTSPPDDTTSSDQAMAQVDVPTQEPKPSTPKIPISENIPVLLSQPSDDDGPTKDDTKSVDSRASTVTAKRPSLTTRLSSKFLSLQGTDSSSLFGKDSLRKSAADGEEGSAVESPHGLPSASTARRDTTPSSQLTVETAYCHDPVFDQRRNTQGSVKSSSDTQKSKKKKRPRIDVSSTPADIFAANLSNAVLDADDTIDAEDFVYREGKVNPYFPITPTEGTSRGDSLRQTSYPGGSSDYLLPNGDLNRGYRSLGRTGKHASSPNGPPPPFITARSESDPTNPHMNNLWHQNYQHAYFNASMPKRSFGRKSGQRHLDQLGALNAAGPYYHSYHGNRRAFPPDLEDPRKQRQRPLLRSALSDSQPLTKSMHKYLYGSISQHSDYWQSDQNEESSRGYYRQRSDSRIVFSAMTGFLIFALTFSILFTLLPFLSVAPLADLSVTRIDNVLAAKRELMFDMAARAKNPNPWSVLVGGGDLGVFAASVGDVNAYLGSGRLDPFESLGIARLDDDPLIFASTYGRHSNSSLPFVTSFTQITLHDPGILGNDTRGNERYNRMIHDQKGWILVVRGVLQYKVWPVWWRVQRGRVCFSTTIGPDGGILDGPSQHHLCDI